MDADTRFFNPMEREHYDDKDHGDQDVEFDFGMAESGRSLSNIQQEAESLGFTESERDELIRHLQDDYDAAPSHPRRSIPVPVNNNNRGLQTNYQTSGSSMLQPQSQASSQGSSGSAFLSSVLNPTASTFGNTQLSHTPPTFGSSYEASHFGKRARSGSVSGRIRSASEYLEERGLLDRQTKGILKDLIIIGDEELQQAIDSYEAGDPSSLEEMINSGALQNRLPGDIDILGDLDLDFLTMNDDMPGDIIHGGTIEALRHPNEHVEAVSLPETTGMHGKPHLVGKPLPPPPSHPGQFMSLGQHIHQPSMVTPQYNDDGIGDLDFAGDLVSDHSEYLNLQTQSYGSQNASVATSPAEASNLSEYEQRLRSNSLFSALLNDPRPASDRPNASKPANAELQFGKWMDRAPQRKPAANRRASAPAIPSGIAASLEAERKRIEKELKKEKREKAKQEKKEKKEREKKAAMMEEEDVAVEVHVSGSGRPRAFSDPNLRVYLDDDGLQTVERPDGWVGAYSPDSRKVRIEKFLQKRNHRVWTKTVKYDVRKNFADSRLRVKGRFVKKEDEVLMRELMSLT